MSRSRDHDQPVHADQPGIGDAGGHNDHRIHELIELERAKLGHEIHDQLLPLVFAARGVIDQAIDEGLAANEAQRRQLIQSRNWLDQAMQVGRQLLTEAHPPNVEPASWPEAAQAVIVNLFPESRTAIHWQIDQAARALPQPIASTLYCIALESIRNAVRHGRARHVHVATEVSPQRIAVHISDDGCGFEPADVTGDRFGIRSMQGRAQLVGGHLHVASSPGGPTRVTVSLPAITER